MRFTLCVLCVSSEAGGEFMYAMLHALCAMPFSLYPLAFVL
jgi:hypothetical protein